MPIGRCQLCLEFDVELLSSHYMPAGFHRIVQDGGPHATQVLGKVALLSSRHQQAHLLCQKCETRFQQRGEDWVIERCWRSPTEFKLLDVLEHEKPLDSAPGVHLFDGRRTPGVELDQIVYLAASIFWRGGVRKWNPAGQPKDPELSGDIDLGEHLEAFRLFLLDKGPFPPNVFLSVWIENTRDRMDNQYCVPPFMPFNDGYMILRSYVPGLVFTLSIGSAVGGATQRSCTARSGFLVVCSSRELRRTEIDKRVRESERKGKLKRTAGNKI